jgi:hypothetical protein
MDPLGLLPRFHWKTEVWPLPLSSAACWSMNPTEVHERSKAQLRTSVHHVPEQPTVMDTFHYLKQTQTSCKLHVQWVGSSQLPVNTNLTNSIKTTKLYDAYWMYANLLETAFMFLIIQLSE